MSFNLRYSTAQDKEQSWPLRKEVLFHVFRGSRAHLIGIQEGLHEQLQEIASACPRYHWIGRSRRGNTEDEFNAVFYLKREIILKDQGDFWLSETPDIPGSQSWGSSLPRMATWILVQWKNREFLLLNTHLDHVSEEARLKAGQLILDRCVKLAQGRPLVITGDFNATPYSDPHAVLCGSGSPLRDVLHPACLLAQNTESTVSRLPVEGPEETYHGFSGQARDRIDWILLSKEWKVQRNITWTYSENGIYPSDHFPILVDLEW